MKQYTHELSMLHHADTSTVERIADHFPAADPYEMKKILAMSERKYQLRKNGDMIKDTEEAPVIVHTSSCGWRRTLSMAACLLICAGSVGGIYTLNKGFSPAQEEVQTAELDQDSTQQDSTAPENPPDKPQKNLSLFRPDTEQSQPISIQNDQEGNAAVPVKDADAPSVQQADDLKDAPIDISDTDAPEQTTEESLPEVIPEISAPDFTKEMTDIPESGLV